MPVLIQCEHCKQKMNAPDAARGKQIRCPKCSAVCLVPPAPAPLASDETERPAPAPMPPAEAQETFAPAEDERVSTRETASPKRRPIEADEDRYDDDDGGRKVRPKRQLVLRLFVLFLGLLGAAGSGAVGALWWSADSQLKQQPGLLGILQLQAGSDAASREALARLDVQSKTSRSCSWGPASAWWGASSDSSGSARSAACS